MPRGQSRGGRGRRGGTQQRTEDAESSSLSPAPADGVERQLAAVALQLDMEKAARRCAEMRCAELQEQLRAERERSRRAEEQLRAEREANIFNIEHEHDSFFEDLHLDM